MSELVAKFTFDTTLSSNNSVFIGGTPDMSSAINWGDGVTTAGPGEHSYNLAGTYTVEVYGFSSVSICDETHSDSIEKLISLEYYLPLFDSHVVIGLSGEPAVNLKTAIFGDGTRELCSQSLWGCTSIESVTLAASVKAIDDGVFYNMPNFADLYYLGTIEQWNDLLSKGIDQKANDSLFLVKPRIVQQITFNTNGGHLEPGYENPMFADSFPSEMPTVERGNFVYDGWYFDNNFTNPVTAGDPVPGSVTIYVKLYNTLTYYLDGGVNSSANKDYYTSVDADLQKQIAAPTKQGCTFEGWYTDSAFTAKVVTYNQLNGNSATLYAKYSQKDILRPNIWTGTELVDIPVDAATINGAEAYVSRNISDLSTMGDLMDAIDEINDQNMHAYFDISSYIPGAFVCLVEMTSFAGKSMCTITDLLANKRYYDVNGYLATELIADYIDSCTVKDTYENIDISGFQTMGELRQYINEVNDRGDHCFFNFSSYIDGAYICTIQMYTQMAINYCYIFDIIGGRIYGSYTGYSDSDNVSDYVDTSVGDVIHSLRISDKSMSVGQLIEVTNRVNMINHHVMLDISDITSVDKLATFSFENKKNGTTVCTFMGLVNGTIARQTYNTDDLDDILLSVFLASAEPIVAGGAYAYKHSITITGEDSETIWTTIYMSSSDPINTIDGLNEWLGMNGYSSRYVPCTGIGTGKIITGIKHSLSDGMCNCMEVTIENGTLSAQTVAVSVASVSDNVTNV